MDFQGVIIAESLKDTSVLEDLQIVSTKVEAVTPAHKTLWLKQWTLHTVRVEETKADLVARKIGENLTDEDAWYADFKNLQFHYIIYRGKIFKVDLQTSDSAKTGYAAAKAYGILLGIPAYQVDFAPEDTIWQR